MQKRYFLFLLPFFLPAVLFSQTEKQETLRYEAIFKEFLLLTTAAAEAKDAEKLLEISDTFVKEHQSVRLARVFIWNKDLGTQTNILFHKDYPGINVRILLSEENVHYADESKINVTLRSDAVNVDFRPPANRIAYYLVFLR
jgi:hypothetical protein